MYLVKYSCPVEGYKIKGMEEWNIFIILYPEKAIRKRDISRYLINISKLIIICYLLKITNNLCYSG